jgi:hypothetical protein
MPLPRLRAPEEDGGILAVPPLADWPALALANHLCLAEFKRRAAPADFWDRQARGAAESAAGAFHQRFGLAPFPASPEGIRIVTGHQPDLFHPGVWIKNFAARALANKLGGRALNLIVDTDLVKTTALRVPNARTGQVDWMPFDAAAPPMPYEERPIGDPQFFSSFPARVAPLLPGASTLLPRIWNADIRAREPRASESTRMEQGAGGAPLLGEALVVMRHRAEARWDCHQGETLLSLVASTPGFIRLAHDLFAQLPRFLAVHNAALAQYQMRRRVRGRNRPLPELQQDGDWLEAPFWIWRAGETVRRRLFVQRVKDRLRLAAAIDNGLERLPLELPAGGHWNLQWASWRQAAGDGWKIRPRALITTLYARLFLADLFIHGLGGGLYDEITDDIIRNFFGLEPPAYVILTATLRLTDPNPPATPTNVHELRRELRDLRYNPDRHLPAEPSATTLSLVAAKQERIAQHPQSKPERWERFQRLHELNEQLRPRSAPAREELERRLAAAEQAAARQRMFHDREYAFVLHSEERLRALFAKVKF